jgi:endonuclease/exonuclease/phosphatase family metal-dependent hydrolase
MSLRVCTYNVRYFGHGTRGLASTARSMRKIATALAAMEPLCDVVCLQEVETASIRSTVGNPFRKDTETQLEHFTTELEAALVATGAKGRYDAYYFPAHRYAAGRLPIYTTGLAVLARHGITVEQHNASGPHDITHRSMHPIRGLKQTRICAHVRLRPPRGEPLDIFNTHLSLPSTLSREFWVGEKRLGWGPNQLAEAKNLVRFVRKEAASERFVVVGDFNALPGSPVYRYLVGEGGLTDAFAHRHGMSEDDLAAWPTAGFMRLRMHLDHMLTGPGLRWLQFDGSRPFGEKASPFHGLSDHAPLVGTCKVS